MTLAEIEKIFRDEAGRTLATLIRLVGDFDLAEDALQDAFSVALERWPASDPPSNPRAWLVNVGRNKAIDRIRRQIAFRGKERELEHELLNNAASSCGVADPGLDDDMLRLIFTCCHPAFAADVQVALTLRTVCSLSMAEVARAFLVGEDAMVIHPGPRIKLTCAVMNEARPCIPGSLGMHRRDAKTPQNEGKRYEAGGRAGRRGDHELDVLKVAAASRSGGQRHHGIACAPHSRHQERRHRGNIGIVQNQKANAAAVVPRFSRGQMSPRAISSMPENPLNVCTDRPRLGTARYGTAKPSNDVNRNRATPICSRRCP